MTKALLSLSLLFCTTIIWGQKKNSALVQTISMQPSGWDFQPGKVEFMEYDGRPSMKILPKAGLVVLKNLDFADGTIEFDQQLAAPTFVPMYFRWQDSLESECFYFRTQRAGNPVAPDAIQYAPYLQGVNLWDLLPYYQANADYQQEGWTHVKLVVSGKQLRVYVNSNSKPTLQVPCLEGNTTHGKLVFSGESYISNLVVKAGQVEGLSPLEGIDPTDNDPRYIRHWTMSAVDSIPKGIDFSYNLVPTKDAVWHPIDAERRGLVNITRLYGTTTNRRITWLKVNLQSATAQQRKIDLGFSDEVWVFINGRYLYGDKNYYGQPSMKEPDGRLSIENTSFQVPLQKGDNELLIGVGNNFYGWGIAARLDKMDGIMMTTYK